MKRYLFFLLVIFLNCTSVNDYYHGKVTDENNVPLEDVIVTVENFENKTKTDKKGYFKLMRSSEFLGKLIFRKEGYKTDTIPIIYSHRGESIRYNFIVDDIVLENHLGGNIYENKQILQNPQHCIRTFYGR